MEHSIKEILLLLKNQNQNQIQNQNQNQNHNIKDDKRENDIFSIPETILNNTQINTQNINDINDINDSDCEIIHNNNDNYDNSEFHNFTSKIKKIIIDLIINQNIDTIDLNINTMDEATLEASKQCI